MGGAHWRLVSLVELAVPSGEPRAVAAAETVLAWLTGPGHRRGIRTIDGLVRRCASQEGNALAACCRLGLAGDARVELLVTSLRGWQGHDGGWNCDPRASGRARRSTSRSRRRGGLHEHWLASGDERSREAALRTAELFLEHRVFRTLATGEPLSRAVVTLHYPPYWHYDVLQALVVLGRMGLLSDPRASDALALVEQRRRPDGLWGQGASWWRPPGSDGSNVEVVDWGRRGPSEMLTLNALRVLRQAGRTASSLSRPLRAERHSSSSAGA